MMNLPTGLTILGVLFCLLVGAVLLDMTGVLHTPSSLAAVEVRSFEGQDLSSIDDFHENSIKGIPRIDPSTYRLTVGGLVTTTRTYTYDEVRDRFPPYSKVVTLECVDGWRVTILWEGFLVRDLLQDAGVDPRANTVIFTARDGYTSSLPLEYLMENDILLAYRMNNVTLPAERGFPFQLVAEDKYGYKWVKWIERVELSDDPEYRGTWERRGYPNSG